MDRFWKKTNAALENGTKSLNELEMVHRSKGIYQQWSTLPPFPYEPLPTPTSIRLLKLEPSKAMQKATRLGKAVSGDAHDDDDDIHFVMHTAELDRDPRYMAVSYTWRRQRSQITTWTKFYSRVITQDLRDKPVDLARPNPDDDLRATRKVLCNGHHMMVFENLFEALKQLRRDRPGEWLWIDALCVNQSDSAERVAQIQIMGRIYQSAQLVVVWLGPFPHILEGGLKTLEEFARSDEPLPANPLNFTVISRSPAEHRRKAWAAMTAYHLALRSYFKRVWVVQELCLARDVIYLHGKHEISLATLLTSCKWCADKDYDRVTAEIIAEDGFVEGLLGPEFTTHLRFLPTTLNARQEFLKGNKWTLTQWFRACNGRLASEVKDYIFAGLSLVRQDFLDIDQQLQVGDNYRPPLPCRPDSGCDMTGTKTAADHSSKFSAPGPSAEQSLTPRGLWKRLAPDYSASDAEVLVNAAACILSHCPLGDLLRLAARLRDQHQFVKEDDEFLSSDLGAFSALPSWVPATGSWSSCLTLDLVSSDAHSPFKATMDSHCHIAQAAGLLSSTSVSISADGRKLSVNAAIFDNVHTYCCKKDRSLEFVELRKLLRFLDQPSPLYEADHSFRLQSASVQGHEEESTRLHGPPCLLEAVACTMIAGHVDGQEVSPFQAGIWLCESLESKVQQMVAESQRHVDDLQNIKQALEAEATKRGQSIEYLKTAEDDTNAKKWRSCDGDLNQGLEKVTGAMAELEALKVRYPHMKWPPAGTVTVVSKEEDVERAKLEERSSQEKNLEELMEKRSINTKSSTGIRETFDRAWAKTTGIADDMIDHFSTRHQKAKGKFRRIVSDQCRNFEERSIETLAWRKICATRKGHILLGPLWLEEGDAVMLLPGVSVPFIFSSEKESLEREEARIEERLRLANDDKDSIWTVIEATQKVRLAEIKKRLHRITKESSDSWVLVGEAYVEGIMQGEATTNVEYKSIDIV